MVETKQAIYVFLVGSMMAACNAYSAGFALQNQNGAGTGYAYAGAAAVAEDVSTIYFNPAGMTYLAPGHHISGALTYLDRSLTFKNHGSTNLLMYPLGDAGGQAGSAAFIPAGFWAMSINPDWRFGIGLSPTFGNSTEWKDTFIGRYQGAYSELKSINLNPSLAWRVNNLLSLGIGFNVVKFDADLQSMVPVTALLPGALVDAKAKLSGDDIGFGYNFGAMFQLTEDTRIGVTYRSLIDLNIAGDLEAPGKNIPAKAAITLPDSASLALSHMISDRLQLLTDVTWTGWHRLPELVVTAQKTNAQLSKEHFGYQNSFRVGLGLQYQYLAKLKLRTGVAWDQSPVRNRFDRAVRLPDADRIWLAIGANYQVTEQISFDLGYAHVFFDQAAIARATNNMPLLQVVRGSFDTAADIFSMQLNYHF